MKYSLTQLNIHLVELDSKLTLIALGNHIKASTLPRKSSSHKHVFHMLTRQIPEQVLHTLVPHETLG
ncbi:hypothetical protein EMIT0347P_80126 [Pseudomonas sp. IT-347P]